MVNKHSISYLMVYMQVNDLMVKNQSTNRLMVKNKSTITLWF